MEYPPGRPECRRLAFSGAKFPAYRTKTTGNRISAANAPRSEARIIGVKGARWMPWPSAKRSGRRALRKRVAYFGDEARIPVVRENEPLHCSCHRHIQQLSLSGHVA